MYLYQYFPKLKGKIHYGILPNTRAGPNTKKNPEERMYSGLIISKSEQCRVAAGIPELPLSFLMRANQAFTSTQLSWLLVILDL